eukprot:2380717-Rhodomonas_salina.1
MKLHVTGSEGLTYMCLTGLWLMGGRRRRRKGSSREHARHAPLWANDRQRDRRRGRKGCARSNPEC